MKFLWVPISGWRCAHVGSATWAPPNGMTNIVCLYTVSYQVRELTRSLKRWAIMYLWVLQMGTYRHYSKDHMQIYSYVAVLGSQFPDGCNVILLVKNRDGVSSGGAHVVFPNLRTTIWRQGSPTLPSWLNLHRSGSHWFPRSWNGRVAGPLNQVLCLRWVLCHRRSPWKVRLQYQPPSRSRGRCLAWPQMKDPLGPVALVAFGELTTGLTHPNLVTGPGRRWQRVQALPDALDIGPVHLAWGHADGTVMSGIEGAQQGQKDVHETLHPVSCHVAMNHALQGPLEVFHHGTFDVVILAGEEVYFPILISRLKTAVRFSVTLSLCTAIFHLIQNGLHGCRHLGAMFAGWRSCPNTLG